MNDRFGEFERKNVPCIRRIQSSFSPQLFQELPKTKTNKKNPHQSPHLIAFKGLGL